MTLVTCHWSHVTGHMSLVTTCDNTPHSSTLVTLMSLHVTTIFNRSKTVRLQSSLSVTKLLFVTDKNLRSGNNLSSSSVTTLHDTGHMSLVTTFDNTPHSSTLVTLMSLHVTTIFNRSKTVRLQSSLSVTKLLFVTDKDLRSGND